MKYKKFKITEQEYEHIKSTLNREPNDFELHLFSATYCEHCAYKHSKELLKLLPRDKAVYCDENAGGVELGEHAILFKMESHNHPCAVEPFNGAATGIGGIVRDVLAMNARPIALCNSLKFRAIQVERKEKREKEFENNFSTVQPFDLSTRTRSLLNGVVEGISTYGNSIGVPTVSTEVLFDDSYCQNPLVNVTAIGIAKKSDILTSNKAQSGLKLMLVGSHTMRDGMGGAAFASKKLSDEAAADKISIQIANPFMKKKLIEACLDIFSKKLVVSCQDCGAAGILSSTSEVAFKSDFGVEIDLAKIHLGDKSIQDFEIMLSETQERMLFVVEDENISQIEQILKKYELGFSTIGEVIEEKEYIIKNGNKILAKIPTGLLVTPPEVDLDFTPRPLREKVKFQSEERALEIRVRGKKHTDGNSAYIYEQYDHTVGGRTQFQPNINPSPSAPLPQRARGKFLPQAVPNFNSLWIYEENCFLGIYTFSAVIEEKPFKTVYDALTAAAEELKNNGFKPIGITNCLNFTNPQIPPTMYEFRETILAIKQACEEIQIPVCSGNVSFYNEYSGGKIKNTPTFTMLGVKT